MNVALFYLSVVVSVAVPLALLEDWGINHFKVGWGEPLPTNLWWGKPAMKRVPFTIVSPLLFTRYHVAMFCVLVPASLIGSAFALGGLAAHPPTTWLTWAIFIVACEFGVGMLENFLFLAFSAIFGKPYPHALARLFRGEATCHPRHVDVFGLFTIPDFYIWIPPLVALLLWVFSRL